LLIDSPYRHSILTEDLNRDDVNLLTVCSSPDNVSGRSRRTRLQLDLATKRLAMAKEVDKRHTVELELQQLLSKMEKHQKQEEGSKMGETHAACALIPPFRILA
jgi:hypothetical protein